MDWVSFFPVGLLLESLLAVQASLACIGKAADVFFLLDSSGSISSANFQMELQFTIDVVSDFDIGPETVQVGVISFNNVATLRIGLGAYTDKTHLMNTISAIPYDGGGTNTEAALKYLHEQGFPSSNIRPGIPRIAIVLTDGKSQNTDATLREALTVRQSGITVFAIGIGSGADNAELNGIANEPSSQFVFEVDSFESLKNIKDTIATRTCDVCSPGYFGLECNETCNCIVKNTAFCDPVNGTCTCKSGWIGNVCDQDIDECDTDTNVCQDNAECNNTDGSYECRCAIGYAIIEENRCEKCPQGFYGLGCESGCTCNILNTDYCSPVNGSCTCATGWQGSTCDVDINECKDDSATCQDNAQCLNTVGSYNCTCKLGYVLTDSGTCEVCSPGYYGLECNETCSCTMENTELCAPVNGTCTCKSGWTGNICDQDIDECDTDTELCQDNAECYNTEGSYECKCAIGYAATEENICETCPDGRFGVDCKENCTCINESTQNCDPKDGACYCMDGYEGQICDLDIDECEINTCQDNAECINTVGSYTCQCIIGYNLTTVNTCTECPHGFYGLACERGCTCNILNTDYCSRVNGSCTCTTGWQGSTCDVDIDECKDDSRTCQDNAQCLNTVGFYHCACNVGYVLTNSGTCEVCSPGYFGFECNETCSCILEKTETCDPVNGDCTCKSGWNGTICDQDIDECDTDTKVCQDNAECNNTEGSYECKCKIGYASTEENRCEVCSPGYFGLECNETCSCIIENTEFCDPVNGACNCKSGWNGNICDQDIDECDTDTKVCQDNAECNNTEGSYECKCAIGYAVTEDSRCEICSPGYYGLECNETCSCTMENTELCAPVNGTCTCKSGWTGNICDQDIDECDTDTELCQDNAECYNTEGSYECKCAIGYAATEENICETCPEGRFGVDCKENCTCINESTQNCDPKDGACYCMDGYEGQICDLDIDECEINTCQDNAECINTVGSYTCQCIIGYNLTTVNTCTECPHGFYGLACERGCTCNILNTDYCSRVNGSCTCTTGWQGSTCDVDIDECKDDSRTCQDNAQCLNTVGFYHCACNVGYVLTNSGTCEVCSPGYFGFECNETCSCILEKTETCDPVNGDCTCKSGWNGTICDQDIDECDTDTKVCQDNAECNNTEGSYECKCKIGYASTEENRCEVCSPGYFGLECNETCSCIIENTEFCDPVNGACNCKSGWNGNICDQDIDECDTDTKVCQDNAECNNTEGSYECKCAIGYAVTEDSRCERRFGAECKENCTCIIESTQHCDPKDGACYCMDGYEGQICDLDIDECEFNTCQNNAESILLAPTNANVNIGYNLTTANTCTECPHGFYGQGCESGCTCNILNTDYCSGVNGSCTCTTGWKGNTCDVDIDECKDDSATCQDNSQCLNTVGSYHCTCKVGYVLTNSGTCEECFEWKYILECEHEYNCLLDNTERCDPVEGTCIYIDECGADIICQENAKCVNTDGSYICQCELGYHRTNNNSCEECPSDLYGTNCSGECQCTRENTVTSSTGRVCNSKDGTCFCNEFWSGPSCDEDVDECENRDICANDENAGCHNEAGGYKCDCYKQYIRNIEDLCVKENADTDINQPIPDGKASLNLVAMIDIILLKSIDLRVSVTFKIIANEAMKTLNGIYRHRLDMRKVRVAEVTGLRRGSLITEYTLTFDDNEEVHHQVLTTTKELSNGINATFMDQNVTIMDISFGDVCSMFIAIHGDCSREQECKELVNGPACMDKENESWTIVIWLSLGFFGLLVALLGIAVCVKRYRKKQHRAQYTPTYCEHARGYAFDPTAMRNKGLTWRSRIFGTYSSDEMPYHIPRPDCGISESNCA